MKLKDLLEKVNAEVKVIRENREIYTDNTKRKIPLKWLECEVIEVGLDTDCFDEGLITIEI